MGLLGGEESERSGFGGDVDRVCEQLTAVESASVPPVADTDCLPDLSSIPTGPYLAVVLSGVDRSRLNGYDLISLIQAEFRQKAHREAGLMASMTEMAYAPPGDANSRASRMGVPAEFAADELRPALTWTRRRAEIELGYALDTVERLPRVWGLLHDGSIDMAKARVLVQGTAHVEEKTAREVVDRLADQAQGLTTGQLRARIRKLCIQVDPEDAVKRQQEAGEDRLMWIEATESGNANLHLYEIPLKDAQAIRRRVHRHLISIPKSHRRGRTHDQLRADIATDMLLGSDPTNSGRGLVDIRVDLTTLAGLDDNPGMLNGVEPVIADIARQVADQSPDAEWRTVITDDSGQVVHVGTTRRRPSKTLSRLVDTLQPVCSFPGCRTPAQDCDLDHITPWNQGGTTNSHNLSPKCRHDHQLKDHGWIHTLTSQQDHWVSPLGHTYITQGQSP